MRPMTSPLGLLVQWVISGAWLWLTVKFLWKDGPPYLFLIFFVVGAAWFIAAVYLTFGRLRYQDVQLDLAEPVHPGGKLIARLRAPAGFGGASAVTATLQCKRAYFYDNLGGNRRHVTPAEEVVWSREARFPVSVQSGNSECPIEFDVPADARATVPVSLVLGDERMHVQNWQKSGFHWQLDVHADAPGIDLVCSFPVTVSARPPGKMAA